MVPFDYFSNGCRSCAMDFDASNNRLLVEDFDLNEEWVPLVEENFPAIELWYGLRLSFEDFVYYIKY